MLRLSVLAYHASLIMNAEIGEEFELSPCNGVNVKVKIEKSQGLEGRIWDTVYLNGRSAGNRHGGIKEFSKLVIAAKPEIEYS